MYIDNRKLTLELVGQSIVEWLKVAGVLLLGVLKGMLFGWVFTNMVFRKPSEYDLTTKATIGWAGIRLYKKLLGTRVKK